MTVLALSRYVVTSPVVRMDDASAVVALSTRTQQTLVVSAGHWEMVRGGRHGELPSDVSAALVGAGLLVADGTNELALVMAASRTAQREKHVLYECIQPTAACNLGCGYCGQQHVNRRLDAATQSAIAERIAGKLEEGYSLLRVGWFGAEPLAGLSAIRTLTERLMAICAERGRRYDAHMVTNGLGLTPRVADELIERLGVSEIEITLDGPAAVHDARRPTKRGRASFERIFANLLALARRPSDEVGIVIRCNVDRTNADYVPDFIDMLADHGLAPRVSLYFAPIHAWGNDADAVALDPQDYADREVDWLACAALRGFRPALLPGPKPLVCMAVNPHAELIDSFGQVFNCSEAPLVAAYGTPNVYAMGSVTAERHSDAADRLERFLDDVEDRAAPCSRCPMLPVCGGACPKQWLDGHVPRPSAKRNMPDRLVLALALDRLAQA
jgi:uncharacterized protein